MPNDRIDEIYRLMIQQKDEFFKYAQQDSKDKDNIKVQLVELKDQADRIEGQTIKTNGRVTKLESQFLLIEDKDKKQVIIGAFKKKQVAAVFGAIGFVWSVVSVIIYAWIKDRFF